MADAAWVPTPGELVYPRHGRVFRWHGLYDSPVAPATALSGFDEPAIVLAVVDADDGSGTACANFLLLTLDGRLGWTPAAALSDVPEGSTW